MRSDEEFRQVYGRHIKRVYQICCLYLKNHQDAEDAAQSVFLKLLTSAKRFDNLEHEKAWIITVAKNHCRDHLRKHWVKKRVDLKKVGETAANDDTYNELIKDLLELPAKYKDVMYLYYIEGYTTKEISKILHRK